MQNTLAETQGTQRAQWEERINHEPNELVPSERTRTCCLKDLGFSHKYA